MQQDLSDTLFGLHDILLILNSSVVGYIHMKTPVKSGRKNSNITSLNMMIQTTDVNYRGVSYRKKSFKNINKGGKTSFPN